MVALEPAGPPPVKLELGDVVRLRRRHACGADRWVVDRLGADIGISCLGCTRHVLLDRRALERRLVEVAPGTASVALREAPITGTRDPEER
jgi:hypothetical protein